MKCQIITLFTIFAVCIADASQNRTDGVDQVSVTQVSSKVFPGPDTNSTVSPITPAPAPITIPTISSSSLPPTTSAAPPTPPPTTTSTTTVAPPPPTTTSTTTVAPPPPPPTTTTSTTSTSTTATSTKAPPTSTTVPPPTPRKFDGPSFVGGIVLASGLVAIGFVAFKFYKARTELNYHTL